MSHFHTPTSIFPAYTCSGFFGQFILKGMFEMVGEHGTHHLLDCAHASSWLVVDPNRVGDTRVPYYQISHLQQAFERTYGERSGRGLAHRTGQAAFHYTLRSLGDSLGMSSPRFRLLPSHQKVVVGIQQLAGWINRFSDQMVIFQEEGKRIRWIVERCPLCWGRHANTPTCHMNVGFLQEFVTWASGGKPYSVVESECTAAGSSACVFTVERIAGT